MGRVSLGERKQVNIRIPVDMLEQVDTHRGVQSREKWLLRAIALALRPTAAALDPELRQAVHIHDFVTPVSTYFVEGVKYRVRRCVCGMESSE